MARTIHHKSPLPLPFRGNRIGAVPARVEHGGHLRGRTKRSLADKADRIDRHALLGAHLSEPRIIRLLRVVAIRLAVAGKQIDHVQKAGLRIGQQLHPVHGGNQRVPLLGPGGRRHDMQRANARQVDALPLGQCIEYEYADRVHYLLVLGSSTAGRLHARYKMTMPSTMNGMLSHWPMLSVIVRSNSSCGFLMNSTKKRNPNR